MAECIIKKNIAGKKYQLNLVTETITSNKTWVVPVHIGDISVRIFGGGAAGTAPGGGYSTGGGCGGCMNNDIFNNLSTGLQIPITIGAGGNNTGSN